MIRIIIGTLALLFLNVCKKEQEVFNFVIKENFQIENGSNLFYDTIRVGEVVSFKINYLDESCYGKVKVIKNFTLLSNMVFINQVTLDGKNKIQIIQKSSKGS